MDKIAFIDQKRQYNLLSQEINQAIEKVLLHGQFILGPEVCLLEERLKHYLGCHDAICVSDGTDALTLSLMAYNVGHKDVVFVPEFTYCATAGSVARLGADCFFVDIDIDTYTMSPISLELAINTALERGLKIKGIIAVDLFGIPFNYDAINAIAKKYNLFLISDAAQAFGAKYNDRFLGSILPVTTTSFYPAKPLGCYGDGGAIFVNDEKISSYIRSARVHGQGSHKYEYIHIGMNSRLDTIQAAILLTKIKYFEQEVVDRNILADYYNLYLDEKYKKPFIPSYAKSVYAQYVIVLPSYIDRNIWQERMADLGIPTMVYYPSILSEQKAYNVYHSSILESSDTYQLCSSIVALPMHGYMDNNTREKIVEAANKVINSF